MRPGLIGTALTGLLIGLVSGLLTGLAMLISLLIYSALVHDEKSMGPTLVLGPIVGGVPATLFGIILGAIAGAVAGASAFRVESRRRCVVFGMTLVGVFGALWTSCMYFENAERFAASAAIFIGMGVPSPIPAGMGMVGGAFVARMIKRR